MKQSNLKVVPKDADTDPVPTRALPEGEAWNDWYDDDALAREWEERQNQAKRPKPPKPRVHRSMEYESLPHVFTPAERDEIVDELIEADKEREQAEIELNRLKETKKEIDGRIAGSNERIREARRRLATGFEERSTEVEKIVDYDDESVTYVRHDTGEEVRRRALFPNERQMPLVA